MFNLYPHKNACVGSNYIRAKKEATFGSHILFVFVTSANTLQVNIGVPCFMLSSIQFELL